MEYNLLRNSTTMAKKLMLLLKDKKGKGVNECRSAEVRR
jgi:hypothetical protein